ncbi:MAG: 30S ribosomal protein S4 [Planctomycetota bacterium]|jgi:small subunit ribosomal protein S4
MARYTGPRAKLCRRLGFLITRNAGVARAYAKREMIFTGGRRRKVSEYGLRLIEKQKLRFYYGCSEKQLRASYKEATRMGGNAGHNILSLLERRLDNVVANLRFAVTIADARQLVSHGHITVNGKKMDVASYRVKEGDVIAVRDKQKSKTRAENALALVKDVEVPDWMTCEDGKLTGKVDRLPGRDDVRCPVEEQKVIEFYSK